MKASLSTLPSHELLARMHELVRRDNALEAETKKLRSPQAARRMLALDNGDQIVRVELVERRPPPRHRYQRAA